MDIVYIIIPHLREESDRHVRLLLPLGEEVGAAEVEAEGEPERLSLARATRRRKACGYRFPGMQA